MRALSLPAKGRRPGHRPGASRSNNAKSNNSARERASANKAAASVPHSRQIARGASPLLTRNCNCECNCESHSPSDKSRASCCNLHAPRQEIAGRPAHVASNCRPAGRPARRPVGRPAGKAAFLAHSKAASPRLIQSAWRPFCRPQSQPAGRPTCGPGGAVIQSMTGARIWSPGRRPAAKVAPGERAAGRVNFANSPRASV